MAERLKCIALAFCAVIFPLVVWLDSVAEGDWSPAYAAFMALCFASIACHLCASVIRDRWNR
jgi:hypothetical protein